jgi:hypothetical protein
VIPLFRASCGHFDFPYEPLCCSWSAVDDGHVPLVVALAGRRREVVQPFDQPGAQFDLVGGGILLDTRDPLGSGDRRNVVALREQPGQRHLRRCGARLGGDGLDLIDDTQVALEVLAGQARVGLAPVVVGKLLERADLPSEETVAERRVGNEADAQLTQQRQQFGFRIASPEGVFSLQRGERVHGVSATDYGGAGLGHSDVVDLARGDQLGQDTDGVLDWGVRVDTVLVVQIDMVGAEPRQRPLNCDADARGATLDSHPTEFAILKS